MKKNQKVTNLANISINQIYQAHKLCKAHLKAGGNNTSTCITAFTF